MRMAQNIETLSHPMGTSYSAQELLHYISRFQKNHFQPVLAALP